MTNKAHAREYRGHMLIAYPGASLWRASIQTAGVDLLMTAHVFQCAEDALNYAAGWLDAKNNERVGDARWRDVEDVCTDLPTPQIETVRTSQTTGYVSFRMVPRDSLPKDTPTCGPGYQRKKD